MHRNYKSGNHSNGRIRYNKFACDRTKNHYIITEHDFNTKVMVDKIYNLSNSNAEEKEFNHRDNRYKLTEDDYDSDY